MVLERLREERTLYDVLMSRALRLASATLGARRLASRPCSSRARRCCSRTSAATTRTATLETLRALLQMIEEKARLVRLLDDYIGGDGLTVVIGSEHQSSDLQRFSLVFCDLLRRPRHGRGRRHRSDPHALLTRHQRGRQPVARHQPGRRREDLEQSELGHHERQQRTNPRLNRQRRDRRSPTRTNCSGSATTSTIGCCARPPSSTTTASASSAIGRAWRRRSPPTSCAICCRSSTISSARSRPTPAPKARKPIARGVELIHRQLLEILRKRGRARRSRRSGPISTRTFTRRSRTSPPTGRRDGEVIEEFGRGYMLNDRMIRPAVVKVAKGEYLQSARYQ